MSSTSSPFGQNEWLVEEMYRKFRDDPSSVDPSWHEFLVDYNPESTGHGSRQRRCRPRARPSHPASAAPAPPPAAATRGHGRAAPPPRPS